MDQYKEELKAKESKDSDLNLLHMLESRITEIVQIEKEVKQKYPKLFYQRLPRFMRRRAASHNVKRIPKSRRPKRIGPESKDRKKLLAHRRKIRYLKNKRNLNKNKRHVYKDENKSLLHKWFAKRFKIERIKPGLEQVPLYNNTKNQRNLYRQTRYGCAYLSLAHLIAIKIEHPYSGTLLDDLNKLTNSTSGFTFSARALETDRYEVVVHLFKPNTYEQISETQCEQHLVKKFKSDGDDKIQCQRDYICPGYVSNKKTYLIMWIPRSNVDEVLQLYTGLNRGKLKLSIIKPCDWMRIRLVGPNSRVEAAKIVENKVEHQQATLDVDRRLKPCRQIDLSIGRCVEEKDACFTYYPTEPCSVDIVFRKKAGRMLWHKLMKNKAHLVGGKRDVDVLMIGKSFQLIPDNLEQQTNSNVIKRSCEIRGIIG